MRVISIRSLSLRTLNFWILVNFADFLTISKIDLPADKMPLMADEPVDLASREPPPSDDAPHDDAAILPPSINIGRGEERLLDIDEFGQDEPAVKSPTDEWLAADHDDHKNHEEEPPDVVAPAVASEESHCETLPLVHCFVNVLDEWAWNLWTFKDNIAAVNETACTHHNTLEKCVNFPGCSRREILDVSTSISDMLLQRNRTGTFLKGYYIAKFSCSLEGSALVRAHRECLLRNRISQKVASLSHYIEQEFRAKLYNQGDAARRFRRRSYGDPHELAGELSGAELPSPQWFCDFLADKCRDLQAITADECGPEAAYLMCKSVADAFSNIFPEQLATCQGLCPKPAPTSAPQLPLGEAGDVVGSERKGVESGLEGAPSPSSGTYSAQINFHMAALICAVIFMN